MLNNILVIGAIFVDVIIDVPQLPLAGADVSGHLATTSIGGCAYNVYLAGVTQHAAITLLAPIGQGPYADKVRQDFKQRQIPLLCQPTTADNGWDLCLVQPDGERAFVTMTGIEQHWQAEWFQELTMAHYHYCYLSGYELENAAAADVILTALTQLPADHVLLFDASPRVQYLQPSILARLLQPHTLIHCNRDELAYLSSATQFDAQLVDIFQRTQTPVVVTDGANGTYIFDQTGKRHLPSAVVPVVNTIGAGDTHCAGVLTGLQRGWSIDAAVVFGNQLAAQVVQQTSGHLS
ncbi:PfkB family carbohydrate kinase [Leuconostoc holzapfelii]|uniref:PfkB family carbohydrate kinase n=1 Tax=Leuconostoc holzapfelii TaxID=434464 RepID=UPI0021C0E9D6|nr:PfkB family carbohydrate kinase [Leuconostoc holzapfelii]